MLCALTKPVCDAVTDFGLIEPEKVLTNLILLSTKSEALEEATPEEIKRIEIEMPAAIFTVRMPARLLLEFNRHPHGHHHHHLHRALDSDHGALRDLRALHLHRRHLHHLWEVERLPDLASLTLQELIPIS